MRSENNMRGERGMLGIGLAVMVASVVLVTGSMLVAKTTYLTKNIGIYHDSLKAQNVMQAILDEAKIKIDSGEIKLDGLGSAAECWRDMGDAVAARCFNKFPAPTDNSRYPDFQTIAAYHWESARPGALELQVLVKSKRTGEFVKGTVRYATPNVNLYAPVSVVNNTGQNLNTYPQLAVTEYTQSGGGAYQSRTTNQRDAGQFASSIGIIADVTYVPVTVNYGFDLGKVDTRMCINHTDSMIDGNILDMDKDFPTTCIDSNGASQLHATPGFGFSAYSKEPSTPVPGGLNTIGPQTFSGMTINFQGHTEDGNMPRFDVDSSILAKVRVANGIIVPVENLFEKLWRYRQAATASPPGPSFHSPVRIRSVCPGAQTSPPYTASNTPRYPQETDDPSRTTYTYLQDTILYLNCDVRFDIPVRGRVAIVIAPKNGDAPLSTSPTTVQFGSSLTMQGPLLMGPNTQMRLNGPGKIMSDSSGAVLLVNNTQDPTKIPLISAPNLEIGRIDDASLSTKTYLGMAWLFRSVAKIKAPDDTPGNPLADVTPFELQTVQSSTRLTGI